MYKTKLSAVHGSVKHIFVIFIYLDMFRKEDQTVKPNIYFGIRNLGVGTLAYLTRSTKDLVEISILLEGASVYVKF